ncbi:MAG: hypothetical protein R3308_01025 [Thiohalobacterales bacterium]|nr:hypothetical protein [Thiohalobacterales bacterium]
MLPLIRISTRRFLARPSRVALSAAGLDSPLPDVDSTRLFTPFDVRKVLTLAARCSESAWLQDSGPELSVWPMISIQGRCRRDA